MNDFDYVDQVFCEIADKEEKLGNNALAHDEKVILAVWHATGLVGNGGLQSFIVWEDANPEIADHFEELGLSELAQIIREFFSLFPNGIFENFTSPKREEFIENNLGKVQSKIDTLNRKFYELMPTVEVKAAAYIRDHG